MWIEIVVYVVSLECDFYLYFLIVLLDKIGILKSPIRWELTFPCFEKGPGIEQMRNTVVRALNFSDTYELCFTVTVFKRNFKIVIF